MTAPTATASNQLSGTLLTDPTDAPLDNVNGNVFANTGSTIIRLSNSATASGTVTLTPTNDTAGTDNLPITGKTYTVPASGVRWLGRRDLASYGRRPVLLASAATMKATIFEP